MSGGGACAVSVDLWLPLFRSTGGSGGYRASLLVSLHTAPLEHSLPLSQPRLELIPGCRIPLLDLGSRQIHHILNVRGFSNIVRARRRITTQNGMQKQLVAANRRAKLRLHFQHVPNSALWSWLLPLPESTSHCYLLPCDSRVTLTD